eukprot:scaffold8369_cov121-Cylindrotheca_fusiformis.AAC.8
MNVHEHEEQHLLNDARSYYIGADSSTSDDDVSRPSSPPPPPPSKSTYSQGAISLDFERVVNEYSIQACRDRMQQSTSSSCNRYLCCDSATDRSLRTKIPKNSLVGHAGRSATRWVLTAIAGILTGLTTVVIVSISETVISFRASRLDAEIMDPSDPNVLVFLRFSIESWAMAFCSCLLCILWVPAAEGSGIPEVKAYLNGVRVRRFSSLSLFVVKIVGTILSIASSLAVGKEGPLIHIGAVVGASCSKISVILSQILVAPFNFGLVSPLENGNSLFSKLWLWTTSDLAYFANDAEKRDLVSIGAAVGFAASFGAPIGGLLFVLDDISTYFDKSMYLRVLVANALGTFCLALYRGDLSQYSVISLGNFSEPNYNIFLNRFEEVPFYVLTGIIGGMIGGTFSSALDFRKRGLKSMFNGKAWQLLGVTLLSLFTSFVFFYATSMAWACRDILEQDSYFANVGHRFFCEEDQVNALATILLGSRDKAIKWILADPAQFEARTLFTVGTLFYFLTLLTFGSALPLGVFTPTVLIGASLGGAGGLILQEHVDDDITPSTFALLGVAAVLTGVQRSTVSICVILIEGTGQIKVLIPVIITVIVARYAAEFVHADGIYALSMAFKGYPYLEDKEAKVYDMYEVGDVMSEPAVVVRQYETAKNLVDLLENSSRNGFPVVDTNGKFLGLVRRNQIIALIECGVFEDDDGQVSQASSGGGTPNSWTPKPGAHKSKDDRYQYLESRIGKEEDKDDDDDELEDDEYDSNDYLLNIRDVVVSYPGMEQPSVLEDESEQVPIPLAGDD